MFARKHYLKTLMKQPIANHWPKFTSKIVKKMNSKIITFVTSVMIMIMILSSSISYGQDNVVDVSGWIDSSSLILSPKKEDPLRVSVFLGFMLNKENYVHIVYVTNFPGCPPYYGCLLESSLKYGNEDYIFLNHDIEVSLDKEVFPPVFDIKYKSCYVKKNDSNKYKSSNRIEDQIHVTQCPDNGVNVIADVKYQLVTVCVVDEKLRWGDHKEQPQKRGKLLTKNEKWPTSVPEECVELLELFQE